MNLKIALLGNSGKDDRPVVGRPDWVSSILSRIRTISLPRHAKRLRLVETLGLGDRRFVAVVEFDQFRFLVGGTSSSLVLLSDLTAPAASKLQEEIAR